MIKKANMIIAIMFMFEYGFQYFNFLAVLLALILCGLMLSITLQQPESLMVYFEVSGHTIIYTFLTRSICDITISIILFGMGLPGKVMAVITIMFLGAARGLAQRRPDIFRELFRPHESDPEFGEVGHSYEEAGDTSTVENKSGMDRK